MSAVSVFNTAVSLSRQGVHQDKANNYAEAARCYREAIAAFASVRCKSADAKVANAIDEKISQYRERLKDIDRYLLSKADFSKLFKSVVDSHHPQEVGETFNRRKSLGSVQHGLQLIEKAKRKDARKCYEEAIAFYEEGMSRLLEAAMAEDCSGISDKLRFKCLLVHERVDLLRNYIESGVSLDDRAISGREINSVELIQGGFDSCSVSPEPNVSVDEDESEDHVMVMEEIRSNFSFAPQAMQNLSAQQLQSASIHSLYPTCEIRQPNVMIGGASDVLAVGEDHAGNNVPLANIDRELSLSSVSLGSEKSISFAYENSVEMVDGGRSAPSFLVGSLSKQLKDPSLQASVEDVTSAFSSRYSSFKTEEKDRNVTELTYVNQMLDPREHPEFSSCIRCSPTSCGRDSGSDSGISDPSSISKRNYDSSSATPTTTPTSTSCEDSAVTLEKLIARFSALNAVSPADDKPRRPDFSIDQRSGSASPPPLTFASPEINCQQSLLLPKVSAPEVKSLSRSLSRKSRNLNPSGGSVDELRVLSEDVVDEGVNSKVKCDLKTSAKVDVYSYGTQESYIPPRGSARRDDGDDEDVSKGCYYLMSCLDAFWIL